MQSTVGTSAAAQAIGYGGSRQVAYCPLDSQYHVVYYDGANLVDRTSADGVAWSGATTINGGGPNANDDALATLEVDSSGLLHLFWGWDNATGHSIYQRYDGTSWLATSIVLATSYQGAIGRIYESGGHVYAIALGASNTDTIYEATDPTGTSTFAANYGLSDPTGANMFNASGASQSSRVLEIVGGNVVSLSPDTRTPPSIDFFTTPAGAWTGSITFRNTTTVVQQTGLQATFASCSEPQTSPTHLHLIYRIAGTGWYEIVYDGATWGAASLLSVMADNDRYPGLMCDAAGTLHLVWCKYNTANDYGIGHATRAGGGTAGGWTAQDDLQAANGVNRTNLGVSRAATSGVVGVVWLEGTASPYNVQFDGLALGGGGTDATAEATGQTVTSALDTVTATGAATASAGGQTATITTGSVTASGTPSIGVLAYDQFAGTSGTALTAHTAPTGDAWTMHPAIGNIALAAPPPQLDGSGGVTGEADGSNVALFGAVPASADYEVQAQWTITSAADYQDALWARLDPAADTGYLIWLNMADQRLELDARVAGANTVLGSTIASPIAYTSGMVLYAKLAVHGTSISASWAYSTDIATTGWRTATFTDSSVTAAGRAGFQGRASDGVTLADFRVQDVGTAYNAPLPATMAVTSSATLVAGSTANTVTLQGTNTAWTTGTTFSAGAGSITETSVNAGTQVATLTYSAPATAQTVTLTDSVDSASASVAIATAATSVALTGPASGFVGVAATYTANLSPSGGAVTGTVTFTPSGGAGDTFTPSGVTLTTGAPSATFVRVPATSGSHTLTGTNNASNPTLTDGSLAVTDYTLDQIVPAPPIFTPNYHTLSIELPYSGDTNEDATCRVQFRPTGSGDAWRDAIQLPDGAAWTAVRRSTLQAVSIAGIGGSTYTTAQAHYLAVGQWALLTGVPSVADGYYRVATVPTSTTFTITTLAGGSAPTPGTYTSGATVRGRRANVTAFYAKLHLLTPNTAYDVRVTWTDPDGGSSLVSGAGVSTIYTGDANLTTLADDLPDVGTLAVTKYVDSVNGTDSGAGTSSGSGAWKTLEYACAHAAANDVVQFAPGFYLITANTRLPADGVVLTAQYPATSGGTAVVSGKTVGQMVAANIGNRAVVIVGDGGTPTNAGIWTSPTGSGDQHAGVWVQCDGVGADPAALVGPATGSTFSNIWKWSYPTGFGTSNPTLTVNTVCFVNRSGSGPGQGVSKWDIPKRVNVWTPDDFSEFGITGGWTGATPAGFAEIVNTNQSHNYGAWTDIGNNQDMYVRLPGDVSPNDCYVFVGHNYNAWALYLDGADQRVSGFEFRCLSEGVAPNHTSTNAVIDHCLFQSCLEAVHHQGDRSVSPNRYADRVLIEYNLFQDTSLWQDSPDAYTIPWTTIKDGIWLQSAAPGSNQWVGVEAVTNQPTPYNGSGDASRTTFRYNTIRSTHDTMAMGADQSYDEYSGYGSDFYANYVDGAQDDGWELTGNLMNLSGWDSYIAHSLTGASFNGVGYGPIYYFDDLHWRTGSDGQGIDHGSDLVNGQGPPIPGGTLVKSGTSTTALGPIPVVFYLSNTGWTDSDVSVTCRGGTQRTQTLGPYPSGGGDETVSWVVHDNVFRVANYLAAKWPETTGDTTLIEDSNLYSGGTAQGTPTVRYGSADNLTVAAWQTASGQGAHDAPWGQTDWDQNAATDALFTDPTNGDLTLVGGAAVLDKGMTLPNLADVLVANGGSLANGGYYGSAPDLGAVEYAAASVDATATVTGQTITASAGTITASGAANVAATGQEATATLAGVAASGAASVVVSGQTAVLTVGTVGATGTATVAVTGQTATVTAGVVPASGGATAPATGQTATVGAGTLAASGAATATAAALTASVLAGTVTASAGGSATAVVTGTTLTASAGAITASGAASAPAGAVTAALTSGTATAHGGASVALSPSTVTLSTAAIAASGAATAVASPATLSAGTGSVTAITSGSAVATVTPLALAATISGVTVQAGATASVAGVALATTAGAVLAATQVTAFVTGVTVSLATSALLASGSAVAAITGALLALAAQGVTASNGLSGDIYVGGAVRTNVLGGAVHANIVGSKVRGR